MTLTPTPTRTAPDRDLRAPWYVPVGNEVALFRAARREGLPVMLKGPTGCGKTRLVEYVAAEAGVPLFTVSCHEDMTASDLLGRYVLSGGDTVWQDGPLTRATEAALLAAGVGTTPPTLEALGALAGGRGSIPTELATWPTVRGAEIVFLALHGGQRADVRDDRAHVLVRHGGEVDRRHDHQPVAVAADAVADRARELRVRVDAGGPAHRPAGACAGGGLSDSRADQGRPSAAARHRRQQFPAFRRQSTDRRPAGAARSASARADRHP